MTELLQNVDAARPIGEAFVYVSDFTNTMEWDCTVIRAIKLTPGRVGLGTEFEVVCALPLGRIIITYKITDFQVDKLIELSGSSKLFDIIDTISFSRSVRGTKIEYRAQFTFPSFVKPFQLIFESSLHKMGKNSVSGLQLALEDNFPPPTTSKMTRRADQLVLPGICMFSRLGYMLGRRNFSPISARRRVWVLAQHKNLPGVVHS
jgi:dehydrogenase/reductase SDR family protein 12